MAHFSKFMRPGASVLAHELSDSELMAAAVQNPDGSIAIAVFNETEQEKVFDLSVGNESQIVRISPQALQTIVIEPKE
jgi:glucosylceramidase